ncbi:MAG TPA: PLP-dependent aminotransferase family protein [Clostridia bacterium]
MMDIKIDRESTVPVYIQIFNGIRDMILSGAMPAGYKLPPERKLADQLGVNRSTVINAYRELKSCGLAESHVGRGTVAAGCSTGDKAGYSDTGVAGMPWDTAGMDRADAPGIPPMPWDQLFSESSLRMQDTTVRDLLKLSGRRDMVLFAAGVSIQGIDSLETLQRIQAEVINEYGHTTVQHVPSDGFYPLKESISKLSAARGIAASAQDIMVLSGSQQGIYLCACAFIDPGDVVFVEEPTFFSAIHIFRAQGARVVGIPTDKEGMRTDLLSVLLKRFKPKLIYTIPDFQNPSGHVMSMERRQELLSLAYRNQTIILEDDPYGMLRYEGDSLPALKAMDIHGHVLYLSSFSKLLFPGFRVGWISGPQQVLHRLTLLKQVVDLHTASLNQMIIDRFLREGLLEDHLERSKNENRKRRDVMLEELEAARLEGIRWNRPEGGLYLWCRLPDRMQQTTFLTRSVDRGVTFVPGNIFYPGNAPGNYIRLNFTYPTPPEIREGVKRLAAAYKEVRKEQEKYHADDHMDLGPIL